MSDQQRDVGPAGHQQQEKHEASMEQRETSPPVDTSDHDQEAPPPLLLTTTQAAKRLNVGRCTMQTLVNEEKVRSLKIGALRRIPVEALDEFISRESQG